MRFTAVLLFVLTLHPLGVFANSAAPQQQDAVSRGSYLVRAADCASCHTVQGGQPFAGGLYMPTPFGRISVPNITPDRETGIGAWSDADFYKAMHEGIGRAGENLYPVFPFPWYTKLTRADVLDIKAYLFSLPPVRAPRLPLKLSWPASERETLTAWRTLFFTPGEFKADPQQTPEINRGAYLVEGPGHCGECHNRRNVVGVSRWSGTLQGGEIEGWYAPNLTADNREGIGSWSVAELTQFLQSGVSPHAGVAFGPMQEVITESLSHLSAGDVSRNRGLPEIGAAEGKFCKHGAVGVCPRSSPGSVGLSDILWVMSWCPWRRGGARNSGFGPERRGVGAGSGRRYQGCAGRPAGNPWPLAHARRRGWNVRRASGEHGELCSQCFR